MAENRKYVGQWISVVGIDGKSHSGVCCRWLGHPAQPLQGWPGTGFHRISSRLVTYFKSKSGKLAAWPIARLTLIDTSVLQCNLHSHTYRCKHATGDAIDYVRCADQAGALVYGVSDHAPMPDGRHHSVRMEMSELDGYQQAVRDAQAAFPKLHVMLALECEDFPEYRGFYQEEILGRRQFDYLVGAAHYTPFGGAWMNSYEGLDRPDRLRAYSDHLCTMMESGLYAFIAHPDIFGCSNEFWTEDLTACSQDILAAAESSAVPLEVNGSGFRKPAARTSSGSRSQYPWLPFWELAGDYDISVVCNSDAHRPEDALANLDDALAVAHQFDLSLADLSRLGVAYGKANTHG